MTIEQLQYFMKVAETLSFHEAAFAMHLTQSSLSKQIIKLEKELQVTLFDRRKRQITLTEEGKVMLKDAQLLYQDYQKMLQHIDDEKAKQTSTLRIAMLPIFSQYDLSKKIQTFSTQNPDINLSLQEIEERDLSFTFPTYDLYILREGLQKMENHASILFSPDTLCAILSTKHPYANQNTLAIQQLQNQPLLFPPAFSAVTTIAKKACEQAQFQPYILRHGRLETIIAAATENEGIALVMKQALPMFHLSNVKVLPFTQPIHGDIRIYYPLNTKKESIQRFLSFFTSVSPQ